ncbi:integral membrane protein 2B-like isoform X1 [Centruroides sculpturatus]|uniref:integral membrane protein 2B-like isoform X1 n=2 Tax=Centruroides sculpturatus TaxID=218467 RepID=UPI000C6DF0DA|nr:integral membrane protein 2B-like isoform X1 [Centruroides sculpturatus]
MTIITQPITEKKLSKQQEPLVKNEVPVAGRDAEEGRPVVVTMHPHVRRVSSTTTLCVFITALLVLTTGIIGGIYLYRQLAHYRLRHFRGWCTVPYIPDKQDEHKYEALKSYQSIQADDASYNNFEQKVDIDIELEQYESIEVPDFSQGRRGRFIHDFSVNKTGIIDLDGHQCFVMPLNRSLVLPPHSLFDLVVKMRAGYYDVDTEIVRETMQVMTPPIKDFKTVGYYIARECSKMPTYRLERVTSSVFKRSITDKILFREFAGKKISEIEIINLEDAHEGVV